MTRNLLALRVRSAWLAGVLLALCATQAAAFPQILNEWQQRYGALSASGENAQCQLCHGDEFGGEPWNAYGWELRLALEDVPGCDFDDSGSVDFPEAFYCVEGDNSDLDTGSHTNLDEIGAMTQPGWTQGAHNTLYTRFGSMPNQLPPNSIGALDPDGTEPIPPQLPPPPGSQPPVGSPRFLQFVTPGDSLQAAVDRATPGGYIFVAPGTYRELGDPTNGLSISKGLHLVGLSTRHRRVVFENAGNQRNGIVAVPDDRTDCMSCHSDVGPPFPILPGVEPGLKMREPMIHGLSISGITIRGFRNNGLFTENVDGFQILGVESIDNRNYGIFPTLSKNGVIAFSKASGSDLDSGIWVETSEKVYVVKNLVEGNVNGFEVSNSDDIVLAYNESRNNTVGAAILLLPDIFDDRAGAKRIHLVHNYIHDNNKPNTARLGSILSFVPSGIGVLYLGVDDSLLVGNRVEDNDFVGIAITDYCVTVSGTPFDCTLDPTITPEFLADQFAANNTVKRNQVLGNGGNPGSGNPFAFAASDLGLLTFPPPNPWHHDNCYEDNVFGSFFALFSATPPACP